MKSRKEKIEDARKHIEEWVYLNLDTTNETFDDLIREFLIEDYQKYNNDNLFKSYIKYFFESYGAKYMDDMFASGQHLASCFLVTRNREYDDDRNIVPLEEMTFYNFKNKLVSERLTKIF